jgi:hypothetical protein
MTLPALLLPFAHDRSAALQSGPAHLSNARQSTRATMGKYRKVGSEFNFLRGRPNPQKMFLKKITA